MANKRKFNELTIGEVILPLLTNEWTNYGEAEAAEFVKMVKQFVKVAGLARQTFDDQLDVAHVAGKFANVERIRAKRGEGTKASNPLADLLA